MLSSIDEAVRAYLESESIPGGLCEGIKKWVDFPVTPGAVPTEEHPVGCVFFEQCTPIVGQPGIGASVTVYLSDCRMHLELYTQEQHAADRGQQKKRLLDLFISPDNLKGILVALAKKTFQEASGRKVAVGPVGPLRMAFGEDERQPFTFAGHMLLRWEYVEER